MFEANRTKILKRLEVLSEALETAFDAILEIQAEQKLISYLISHEGENPYAEPNPEE